MGFWGLVVGLVMAAGMVVVLPGLVTHGLFLMVGLVLGGYMCFGDSDE